MADESMADESMADEFKVKEFLGAWYTYYIIYIHKLRNIEIPEKNKRV